MLIEAGQTQQSVSAIKAGMTASCPQCGKGQLFKGILTPNDQCNVCELDYSFIDSGDGPAVFVIFILGFLILAAALFVESSFNPPLWLHAVLWIPIITFACIWALRFTKAMMVAIQFKTKARQTTQIEKD